jgi:hypothetical protein
VKHENAVQGGIAAGSVIKRTLCGAVEESRRWRDLITDGPDPLADLWIHGHSPRFKTAKEGRRDNPAMCRIWFWLAFSASSLGLQRGESERMEQSHAEANAWG